MKPITIQQLSQIVKAEKISEHDELARDIEIDSRKVKQGDCFLAIKGDNFDGHDYIEQAFKAGAVCAVVEKGCHIKSNKPVIKVNSSIKALGLLANYWRTAARFKVVAITGSVGKTTTRQMIAHVLAKKFVVHQSPKNFNNFIGLPLTLLTADENVEIVVAELGSNHIGEIQQLSLIASPDVAVVTNVCPAHIEGFGSLNEIAKEKLSIVKGLKKNGKLILNADSELLIKQAGKQKIIFSSFGYNQKANTVIEDASHLPSQNSFVVDEVKIVVGSPSPAAVTNSAAALACCKWFGIDAKQFAEMIADWQAVSMRCEVLEIDKMTVINDCYNANPASMKNAIDMANNMKAESNGIVFVCGDMAELGDRAEKYHEELGYCIAQSKIGQLLAVGKFAKVTCAAAKKARASLETEIFDNTAALCNNISKYVANGDIILVKGSRINGLEVVVRQLAKKAQ